MKIYFVKLVEVENKWIVIDVEGVVVGCLVFFIVMCFCGKYCLDFILYVDIGDYVVVINVEKVVFIGNKCDDKCYYCYIGYLGGIKEISLVKLLDGCFLECVLEVVVKCMLLKESLLVCKQFFKLCVYVGIDYKYEVQQLEVIDFKFMNFKNV